MSRGALRLQFTRLQAEKSACCNSLARARGKTVRKRRSQSAAKKGRLQFTRACELKLSRISISSRMQLQFTRVVREGNKLGLVVGLLLLQFTRVSESIYISETAFVIEIHSKNRGYKPIVCLFIQELF